MGSLQKLVSNIFVRKVEHDDSVNKVYIKCEELSLDNIREAELMANKIIGEAREVKEHNFQSIEEARKAFPQMRAHEERISGNVRVVEIDGYDYAACAREHTKNASECGLFIVTHVSREKDEHEVEFVVGEQAKLSAVEMSMKCISVAKQLGASMKTLESTAKNLKDDLDMYRNRLNQLTEQLIGKIIPQTKDDKLLYAGIFEMLDDSTLIKKAGEIIKQSDTIVAFINANNIGMVLLACNDKLPIDCNSTLKSVLGRFQGKGGGKPNFANGSVPRDKIHEAFDALLKEVDTVLFHSSRN
jgi:alanyl-tRNA synthetase